MNEQEKRYSALLSRLAESGFRFCPLPKEGQPSFRDAERARRAR